MIELIISDPQPILREGIKHIISQTSDINISSESNGTPNELSKILIQKKCDVLLADMNWDSAYAAKWLNSTREAYPGLKVIAWSYSSDNSVSLALYKNGIAGYIDKNTSPQGLVKIIRSVYTGAVYIPIDKRQILLDKIAQKIRRCKVDLLSDREKEVLKGIAKGESTSEIAESLSISPKTISTHRLRIYKKIGVKTDVLLSIFARKSGLLKH